MFFSKHQIIVLIFIFSSSITQATQFENFEKFLKLNLDEKGSGVTYIVTKNGKTIYSGAYGMANIESGVPLKTSSNFKIGSLTKQITSAAIMMLQEQGKLSVKDNIHQYIPDFPTQGYDITIENLLSHTAGLARNPKDKAKLRTAHIDIEKMMSLIAKEKIQFVPGEKMAYSNMGYMLLGRIIEVVSGQSYGEYVKKNIFDKLAMKHSSYGYRRKSTSDAEGYFQTRNGVNQHAKLTDISWSYSAGGLISNVNDFSIWYSALAQGKLVTKSSYQQMTNPFKLNDGSTSNYGFGLNNITLHNQKAVIHQGSTPGYKTSALYFPDESLYIAVFGNFSNANTFQFASILAAKMFGLAYPEFEPIVLTESQQKNILGKYRTSSGSIRTLFMEEGKMYSRNGNALPYAITPLVNNAFLYDNSLSFFTIRKDDNGSGILEYYPEITSNPQVATKFQ